MEDEKKTNVEPEVNDGKGTDTPADATTPAAPQEGD